MGGKIDEIISATVAKSGLSHDKIEELSSMMVTYLNIGSPFGITSEGFYEWYTKEMGGTIDG